MVPTTVSSVDVILDLFVKAIAAPNEESFSTSSNLTSIEGASAPSLTRYARIKAGRSNAKFALTATTRVSI